jgi:hypothetical protein
MGCLHVLLHVELNSKKDKLICSYIYIKRQNDKYFKFFFSKDRIMNMTCFKWVSKLKARDISSAKIL